MKDDFDEIIDLFSLEAEEKEKRLDEIFSLSVAFIEKYKHVQHEGSAEDKKNIIKRLDQFVFRKHLVITFEMLSVNLYEFIKMNNF